MKSPSLLCLALALPSADAFLSSGVKASVALSSSSSSSAAPSFLNASPEPLDEEPAEESTSETAPKMEELVEVEEKEETGVEYETATLTATATMTADAETDELKRQKKMLFELLGKTGKTDSVLSDPITKEAITIETAGVVLGDSIGRSKLPYKISSPSNQFGGSSDTFLNLLEPLPQESVGEATTARPTLSGVLKQALPYIPPPLRGSIGSLAQLNDDSEEEYVPMRDLFTSPAVSFAYERGWRQGFAQAGFPGADTEATMAMDYFAPVVAMAEKEGDSVVVDMSCATGLFTRRFASVDQYSRVLGCDYSESMLTEARRRISLEPKLQSLTKTKLDLVRLDVGQIPMQEASVDCLHAGAAMHCWPDLDAAAREIYRVLKPGGRYFATTFLSTYFSALSNMDGSSGVAPSQQAFQYFESTERLKDLLVNGGFDPAKVSIEVLGAACVVIRAEK